MRLLARPWIEIARVRQRLAARGFDREELIRRHAPGRSFADIGCMWSVNGRIGFVAEESGATRVTGLDVMDPTPEYASEHERRGSEMRFVNGDIHEPATAREVGPHQVVWCSGVLYHSPNPMTVLERLHEITEETLILATETLPEVPGLRQAAVFYPGLGPGDRALHASARPGQSAEGITTEFSREQSFGAWWFGMTPSAVVAMVRANGFEVIERHGGPLHITLIARRS